MPAISELNRTVIIRHVAMVANERGMPVKLILSTQTTFAKVNRLSGGYGVQQGQQNFSSSYAITVRYEPNRIIANNDIIEYGGERFIINDVAQQDEGRLQWVIIKCTKDDHSGPTSGEPMLAIKEIHVKGEVAIGGAGYENWIGSIIAFRDGVNFTVVRNGSAADKQINYNPASGLFTYPSDLAAPTPNEATDIYFL